MNCVAIWLFNSLPGSISGPSRAELFLYSGGDDSGAPPFFLLQLTTAEGQDVQVFRFTKDKSGEALTAAMVAVQSFIQSVQPKKEA